MSNPINGYALVKGPSVCPATEQELKDFLRLDDESCGSLQIYLESAKDAVIAYLGTALLEQEYTIVFDGYPYDGTATYGLSRDTAFLQDWVKLPYAKLMELVSVEVIDEENNVTAVDSADYFVDIYSTPARIRFGQGFPATYDFERLKITYMAGYGTDTEDVPLAIRLGILQVAGYLYEHRGVCQPATLISDAGATIALNPYRIIGHL